MLAGLTKIHCHLFYNINVLTGAGTVLLRLVSGADVTTQSKIQSIINTSQVSTNLFKMYAYSDVRQWTHDQVSQWLQCRGYNESLCATFMDIDGEQLLELTESRLTAIVKNGIMRKRLARDVRLLLRSLDYSESCCEETAEMLADISSDMVEFSHRLVTAGLAVETIGSVTNIEERLDSANIDTLANYHKIKAALEREQSKRRALTDLSEDVLVLSNHNSKTFASLVNIYLRLRGVNTTINTKLHHANTVVVVLEDSSELDSVLDDISDA